MAKVTNKLNRRYRRFYYSMSIFELLYMKIYYLIFDIKHWINKWKIVNSDKYSIEKFPYPYIRFELTKQQMDKVEKLFIEKGNMDYTFYPCSGIGWGFKVKIWKTNEEIDLTDVSNW